MATYSEQMQAIANRYMESGEEVAGHRNKLQHGPCARGCGRHTLVTGKSVRRSVESGNAG